MKSTRRWIKKVLLMNYNKYNVAKTKYKWLQNKLVNSGIRLSVNVCAKMNKISTNKQFMLEALLKNTNKSLPIISDPRGIIRKNKQKKEMSECKIITFEMNNDNWIVSFV